MTAQPTSHRPSDGSEERTHGSGTGSDDYSAVYYHDYSGPPYTYEEPHWQQFFGGIADRIIALFEPRTTYDAGCAKGFMVRALAERGVDAHGGDISEYAISSAPPGLAERLEVRDLTQPFTEHYDLITCIEVVEHMNADDARLAVQNICAATDVVVLSTTPDDFAESTHINIRPAADWAQEFGLHGFFRRTDVDPTFVSPWAVVFARQQLSVLEVVTRYEQLLQPLQREVQAKRQGLLEAQRDLNNLLTDRNDEEAAAEAAAAAAEQDRQQRLERQRWQLIDEALGLRAELAQTRMMSEKAVAAAGLEVARLRPLIADLQRQIEELKQGQAGALVDAAAAATAVALVAATVDKNSAVELVLADRDRAVADLKSSQSWRIGQLIVSPTRILRRLLGR